MRTVGVEEELLLVHPTSGETAAVASTVLRPHDSEHRGNERDDDRAHAGVGGLEGELQEQQVETNSEPHLDLTDLEQDLRDLRARVDDLARAAGSRTAAIAAAPLPTRPVTTPKERYQRMAEVFGPVEREQLTCGCHIHVEVASSEEGVLALDRIRAWLPVLTALSGNSPYWNGRDTGYASFRHQLWAWWPTAGPPEPFGSLTAYEALVESLVATGAAMDRGMIYFDARLSATYPTLEVRVADVCVDPADAVTLAGLARALVDTAAMEWAGRDADTTPATAIRAASWRASRYGTTDRLVHPGRHVLAPAEVVVRDLLAEVRPALGRAGDIERVEQGVDTILRRGTGSERQRSVVAAADGDLRAAVRWAVEEGNRPTGR